MIRRDERKKNGLQSLLIGVVAIVGLGSVVVGAMCNSYRESNQYDVKQQCIQRHYKVLGYKVTTEQSRYIREACGLND